MSHADWVNDSYFYYRSIGNIDFLYQNYLHLVYFVNEIEEISIKYKIRSALKLTFKSSKDADKVIT